MDDNKKSVDDLISRIDEKIIELLESSKSSDSLSSEERRNQMLDGIKSGKVNFISSWNDITLSDLLSVDENNISYLEYVFKNNVYFSDVVERELFSNLDVLYFCAKNDYFKRIYIVPDEDIYFEKSQDGKSLIEYIFEHNVEVSYSFFSKFEKHVELVDYLVKYDIFSLSRLSPKLIDLLLEEQNGILLISIFMILMLWMLFLEKALIIRYYLIVV